VAPTAGRAGGGSAPRRHDRQGGAAHGGARRIRRMRTATLRSWATVDTGPFDFAGGTRRRALSYRDFVSLVNPRFRWYRHAEALAAVLQRVADGEVSRLMVFMPPRHGKSEEVSRLFPAYYLLRHPAHWVGLSSYAADLAYTFSRAARDNYQRAGGAVRRDAAGVTHWETGGGGGMWA